MKLLIKLYLLFALSALLCSCKKESVDNSGRSSSTAINHPPVANAGDDIALKRVSCSSPSTVELDGSGSSDPDYYKLLYGWTKVSGPSCTLSDINSPNAHAADLEAGQYAFELKITDPGGLSSKDTVVVNVTGSPSPGEINLDVNINGGYSFSIGNGLREGWEIVYAALCQLYGRCPPLPPYTARTSLTKNFDLPTLGQFNFKVDETADTAVGSSNHETKIVIINANTSSLWLSGQCSINFKQLIQGGGGLFNGTYQINDGSALGCDQNIFTNLAPLTVSGSLDTTTHTVTFTLKGKVYF